VYITTFHYFPTNPYINNRISVAVTNTLASV
jgi:hypothetical protein